MTGEIRLELQAFKTEKNGRYDKIANKCKNKIAEKIQEHLINNPDMRVHRAWGTEYARGLYNVLYFTTFLVGLPLFVKCATGGRTFGFYNFKTLSQESAESVYRAARKITV